MYGWSGETAERLARWVEDADPRYREPTLALWTLAVAAYVVGDTGLTVLVLELGGYEANPVARALLSWLGYAGLVVQKAAVLVLLVFCWRYYPAVGVDSPDPWRLVVPAIPFLRGIQLTTIHASNVVVLL